MWKNYLKYKKVTTISEKHSILPTKQKNTNKNRNGHLIYKFVKMNIIVIFEDVLGPFEGKYVPMPWTYKMYPVLTSFNTFIDFMY